MNTLSLNRAQRVNLILLATSIGILFSAGFIPTATHYGTWMASVLTAPAAEPILKWVPYWAAPALALFFHLSLRSRRLPAHALALSWRPLPISLLPLGLALAFGLVERVAFGSRPLVASDLLWTLGAIPVLEELLFRGWLFSVFERLFDGKRFTLTNPFSASVWGTALAFALWHLQNLKFEPGGLVLFQVFYTFFAGLWLGLIRQQTARLWPCIAIHSLANLLTLLPRYL